MPVFVDIYSDPLATVGQMGEALTLVQGVLTRMEITGAVSVTSDPKKEGQESQTLWEIYGVPEELWPKFVRELGKLADNVEIAKYQP